MAAIATRSNGQRKVTFGNLGKLTYNERSVDPVLTIEVKGKRGSVIRLPKFFDPKSRSGQTMPFDRYGNRFDVGKKLVIKLHSAHDPKGHGVDQRLIAIMIFSNLIDRRLDAFQKSSRTKAGVTWIPQYTNHPVEMSFHERDNIVDLLKEIGPAIYEGFSDADQKFIQSMLKKHLGLQIAMPDAEIQPFDVFSPFNLHAGR